MRWLLIGLGPASAVLLGQTSGDTLPGGYVSVGLISSAVTGLGVVLSGRIVVPTFAYTRERDRADKNEQEVARLNELRAQDAHTFAQALEASRIGLDDASKAVAAATLALHDATRDRKGGR